MDLKILRVKSFNLLILFLIAAALILLITTSTLFVYSFVDTKLSITSVIGFIGLLLISFPICIYLIISNKDRIIKSFFTGLLITIIGLIVSGTIWYIIPANFSSRLFVPIGMFLMIFSYSPMIYVLYRTYKNQKENLPPVIKLLIGYVNAIFTIFLLYFALTHIPPTMPDNYNILIYTVSMVCDVVLITLSIALILINIPTKLRYIFSITFGFFILSFIGDTLKLLETIGLYFIPGNSQIFYDMMIIFLTITLLIFVFSNIKTTTVEEVNKKLQDTTLVVDDLITQSPDAMCMADVNGLIVKANQSFMETFGIQNRDAVSNINIFTENGSLWGDIHDQLALARSGKTIHLNTIVSSSGQTEKHLSIKLYPTLNSDKKISHYILLAEDITERIRAENALKKAYDDMESRVKERTAELSILNEALQKEICEHKMDEEKIIASLKEKDVLLKEIHHRVKNNMQVISSMLGLQALFLNDPRINDMLKDCQNRIKSMALIHEKLYQSDNMAKVDFAEYVDSLIRYIYQSHTYCNGVKITSDVNAFFLSIDTAIPLGLIINELTTNALKHAFPKDKNGSVEITINSIDQHTYELIVRDNGIGLPRDFELNNLKSLGLNLVTILVEQIDGDLSIKNDNGTVFTIKFPV